MKRAAAEARVGTVVSERWTLERLLGVGGMASVYVGRHKIGRLDAIKILHPEIAEDPKWVERFEREARAANLFKHTGAVEVRDLGKLDDGTPYLVMELVEGRTLGELGRKRSLTKADILRLADELLDVLAAAHERGIVHRDIKPDNLLVGDDGRLRVLDFGIARLPGPQTTTTGTAMGTASYMPPEQIRGDHVDARADLFAVGASIFRLLTGRALFEAGSDAELIFKMGSQPASPIRSIAPEVDEHLASVVDRALSFRASDRYADARAMQEDIRALREGREPPHAKVRPDDVGTRSFPDVMFPDARKQIETTHARDRSDPIAHAATHVAPTLTDAGPRWAPASVRKVIRPGRLRRYLLLIVSLPFLLGGLLLLSAQIALEQSGRGNWIGWVVVVLLLLPGVAAAWGALES